MENNFDTIVAIATPMSVGAIGIIRLSGSNAFSIAKSIFSKDIHFGRINYGHIIDNDTLIDEVILLPFKAPHSYTAEDVVEIQAHGSPSILDSILKLILSKGARLASRGEFTKRAFLNHRIDLTQAEAVMDLINSKSDKASEGALNNLGGFLTHKINEIKSSLVDLYSRLIASIDFPDEVAEIDNETVVAICNDNIQKINDIVNKSQTHNFIRDGINISLIGKPNVGKSSLFNAILNYSRAIVTPIEGTTRDIIRETLNLNGYLVNFIDTAGIRDKKNADLVEQIGIDQSYSSIDASQIVMFLFEKTIDEIDSSLIETAKDKKVSYVQTKCDIYTESNYQNCIQTSSKTGFGVDKLKEYIVGLISEIIPQDTDYTTNLRQQQCLINAKNCLQNLVETSKNDNNSDLFSYDLKGAILSLGEVTGEVLTDSILDNVFNSFCIGK